MGPSQDVQILSDRVSRLERLNRRLVGVLLALGFVAFAAVAAVARAVPDASVIEATRFVLKSGDGAKRGEIVVGPDDIGRLVLYGPDGERVAQLPMSRRAFPLQQ